jgi:hypothetical protein
MILQPAAKAQRDPSVIITVMRLAVCSSAAVLALALASGCSSSGSPTAPRDQQPGNTPPPATGHIVTGRLVDAVSSSHAPIASGAIAFNGSLLGHTEADGTFRVGFQTQGVNRVSLTAPGFLERQTGIQAPSLNLQLSLIPAGFDLAHFNQMWRHVDGNLTRWTTAPKVIIERRVLQFTNLNAPGYVATSEQLTDAEVARLITDVTDGYAMLTDNRLGPLVSVTSRTAGPGDTVTVGSEAGTIVITRQIGLTAAANFWGYARWGRTADAEVTNGFIIVDRDFAVSPARAPFYRSLHMHEFGHTLGAQHVTGIESVMNSDARKTPNDFDLQSARLVMRRPLGNRTPDIDPASHSATTLRGARAITWHGAH